MSDIGNWQSSIRQKLSVLTKAQLGNVICGLLADSTADRDSLIDQLIHTTCHNNNDSITTVDLPTGCNNNNNNKEKKHKNGDSSFQLSNYRQRHIALQIQYDGVNYCGFASQETETAIENYLFAALTKVNLIEDRKTCNYSRCGRTDRGVSALGQVVALHLRSAFPNTIPDEQMPANACDSVQITEEKIVRNAKSDNSTVVQVSKDVKELDYCTMINRCLPEDIRVIGWCPVTSEFSARFSATYRKYRYFFVRKDLDVNAMNKAASYLIGSHDFRNICKLDVANPNEDPRQSVWMLEIQGIAFLWHMVRCIMAILFFVGEGNEAPEIVQELLNIEQNPAKPSYSMAADAPLVLHECGFERLHFQHSPRNLWNLSAHFQATLEKHLVAAARARNSLDSIMCRPVRACDVKGFLQEMMEQNEKASKRIMNKSNERSKGNSISKRKFDQISEENYVVDDRWALDVVDWSTALSMIYGTAHLQPSLATTTVHVNLLQRNREHAYTDRIQNLSGLKKDRFERHVSLSTTSPVESTPQFFERMRQQGSL